MNCACAYYDTAEHYLLLILLRLRTALAPYWQSIVHLNCACVYYNTLLLHKIDKIKMAGSICEMSSEMGDNHGNFDLSDWIRVYAEKLVNAHNTWINKSRDWHIDGVVKKSSVWFFMSTNLQKVPVKILWHSDVWSTSYSDLSDASLDILKTMYSKQFRVFIYHCFMMEKKHSASSAMACKVLRGLCSIKNNHLSVICWV